MIHINELKEILPISYGCKKLDLITDDDLDWYIDNCRSAYYEKYLDFKFSKDIQYDKLKCSITNMVNSYKANLSTRCEARLVLRDKLTNSIYGGCTVYEDNEHDNIELAYWVLPEYQGKGICKQMLNEVLNKLNKSDIPFNIFIAVIREDNISSIKLAEVCGFSKLKVYNGKYCKNIVYYKARW